MNVSQLVIRESVRQTLADYTAATDRFDLTALAACFTADGVLEFTGSAEPLTGPAAIEAGLREAMTRTPEVDRRLPSHVRHHVSSVRFASVSTGQVEVSSYFVVFTDVGVDHWGRYRDVLAPVGDRWLFEHRRINVDGFAKDSLMGAAASA
jgi:hypothetical protein